MKASRIKTQWLFFRTCLSTVYFSMKAILVARFAKNPRRWGDICVRGWSKNILALINLNYKIIKQVPIEYLSDRRYILMSNHSSLYDIPLIFLTLPGSIRMVAKSELRKIPVFGKAMAMHEFVFIHRGNREQALKDLEATKKNMQNGIIPWMAPEGTRSRTGKMLPFKKGGFMLALQTDAIIIPIGIRGIHDVLPPKQKHFELNLGTHVEVHVGKPIDSKAYCFRTRDKFMKAVENSIRELANQPIDEVTNMDISHESSQA